MHWFSFFRSLQGRTHVGLPQPAEGPAKASWKAKAALKNCTVYQLVWTVYVHGKKYSVVFHMVSDVLCPKASCHTTCGGVGHPQAHAQTMSHSEARLQINGVELMRRKYKIWQQVLPVLFSVHAETAMCCTGSRTGGPLVCLCSSTSMRTPSRRQCRRRSCRR